MAKCIFFSLVAFMLSGFSSIYAEAPQYGSLKGALNEFSTSEYNLEEKLIIANELIRCRTYFITGNSFNLVLERMEELKQENKVSENEITSFKEDASKCIGLQKSDFYMVEKILREAAEAGDITAQLNYYVYAAPNSLDIKFSSPEISIDQIASNSILYLNEAAKKGEFQALLKLAEIHYSGQFVSKDLNIAASYLQAYEACSEMEVAGEYEFIYSEVLGKEEEIAKAAQDIIAESCY